MKNKEIKTLINECIMQMRTDGYTEKCIDNYRRRWRNGIISYMSEIGESQFTAKIGDFFLLNVLPKYAPTTRGCFTRSIRLLVEFMETGIVRLKIIKLRDYPLDGEIGDVVLQHLDNQREQRISEQTIWRHRNLLYCFIEGLKHKGISKICDITQEAVISFLDQAQTSKREHFYAIRQFCLYLYKKGLTPVNLAYILVSNNFTHREKLPSVYNSDEIEQIEKSIEQYSVVGKRDYAIFLLASKLGLRSSDIAALTWNDIDWDNGRITIYQHKTNTPIELPLLQDLGEALVTYARDSRPKSHFKQVFLSAKAPYRPITTRGVNGTVTKIIKSSGIDTSGRRFGPHSMRHSLASNMLCQGISLPIISSVLGHESTQTTMEYLRIDVVNLRECVLEVPLVAESFYLQKGGAFYD